MMTTADELREIATADAEVRPGLVNDFLARRDGQFRRIGSRFAARYKAPAMSDDFISVVRLTALDRVQECIADPAEIETTKTFEGLVAYRAARPASKLADELLARAPGASIRRRRRGELFATRDELRMAWGREPTDQEVVDETNRRLAERRCNPTKQGVVYSLDDLRADLRSVDVDDHPDAVSCEPESASQAALTGVEIREVARLTVAAARESGEPQMAAVAEHWFAGYLNDHDGPPPSAADIARVLGISSSSARAKVNLVRRIAADIVSEHFGVVGPTA